ncbi:hypothetical protein Sjap_001470 [Stephania japonica]|uniref:Uncharacterized protein n=1 Tax=Stephania japonica TaxID=461633 RepID=A0AAP0KMK0_9MAGN
MFSTPLCSGFLRLHALVVPFIRLLPSFERLLFPLMGCCPSHEDVVSSFKVL